MGVEYAIVHDETHEAYELGKGYHDWYVQLPRSRDEILQYLVDLFGEELPFMRGKADAVWAFIESHPGCRMISDTGDALWTTREITEREIAILGRENLFREVGSLYDKGRTAS